MIPSLYTIDFIHGPEVARMLDAGEMLTAEPLPQWQQAADRYAPIGAPWGEATAKGAAVTTLAWGVIRKHASHADLRAFCMSDVASIPSGITGTLRVTIVGGESWEIADVTVMSAMTMARVPCASFETVSSYVFTGGQISQLIAAPVGDVHLPSQLFRITEETGANGLEKWAEWGAEIDDDCGLTGNVATGWTSAGGVFRMTRHRSENLTDWDGQFVDCVGSPATTGEGSKIYWSRSVFPMDSARKTGHLWCQSDAYGEDSRNGLFTSLILDDVSLDLPGFLTGGYQMPGDASAMGAHLDAIYPGSTVTAASATSWRIDIVGARQENYYVRNYLGWPGYYIMDMGPTSPTYGQMVILVNGRFLNGEYVNDGGVRTFVSKQFSRDGYTLL